LLIWDVQISFYGIGENNMKPNAKNPAGRTKNQDDQEYNILFNFIKKHYYMLVKLN